MRTDDDEMSPEFIPIIEKYIKATYGAKSYNKPRVGKKTGDVVRFATTHGDEEYRVISIK